MGYYSDNLLSPYDVYKAVGMYVVFMSSCVGFNVLGGPLVYKHRKRLYLHIG